MNRRIKRSGHLLSKMRFLSAQIIGFLENNLWIELAKKAKKVAFIDKAGRIKPCGGAVPPRLIEDFNIPEHQVVAKIRTARMISPTARKVDMPIENGFVGMVDRENFDEFLRNRACEAGAKQYTGTFLRIERHKNRSKNSPKGPF